MSFLDVLRFAGGALRGHKLRTGLSMLGVAIGVTAVVVLTSLGEGAREYVVNQFASLGTDILIVLPGKTETTGGLPGMGGVPRDLTLEDAMTLARGLPGVRRVAPVSMGNERVSSGEFSKDVAVVGTTAEMLEIRHLEMGIGQFLSPGEWDRGAQVAVLGHDLARDLFPGRNPLGQVIRIGDFRMRVIGVLAAQGVSLGVDFDTIVMVPVATGMRMFNRTSLFRILLTLSARADVEQAKERITTVLKDRHAGEEDFTLITQDAVMSSFGAILQVLTAAIAGIAAISLTVAGIGIMNVMLVSVSERTSEIGLLKAVGAHRAQILTAFLVEAVLLSLAGGVAGLLIAWGLLESLMAVYPAFPAEPPAWAVAAALGVSLLVGAVFGVLPARQATRLDPISALRS
jgi:putative ABC transport system permease protein